MPVHIITHSFDAWTLAEAVDSATGNVRTGTYALAHEDARGSLQPVRQGERVWQGLDLSADARKAYLDDALAALPSSAVLAVRRVAGGAVTGDPAYYAVAGEPEENTDPVSGTLDHWKCYLERVKVVAAEIREHYD
jgi:hypothetical protein